MDNARIIMGRYRLGDKLGEGGYGAVYRAEHLGMGTSLALKLLHPVHSGDPKIATRFEHEAKRTARLKHPHTISVFDFGQTDDGTLFLAMELLEGQTLAHALHDGPLAPERAVRVLGQILSALAMAHALGLVHRDLKPDNIFLVPVGGDPDFVKVLDFGISKALDASTEITASGTIIGTPAYMAPEQCRGRDVDARSDLYSIGCVAHHMLAGQAPFRSDNALGYLLAHVQEPPPPLPNSVPPGLASWVSRLLAKAPEDRFQNADDAAAALATALSGEATWQYAAAPASLTHHGGERQARKTRETTIAPGRRMRWLMVAAGLALAIAAFVVMRPDSESGQPAAAGPVEQATEALGDLQSARAMSARTGVRKLLAAAQLYLLNQGRVPESVGPLVERGYIIHSSRRDPWGRDYRIEDRSGEPRVCSLGRDGVPDAPGAPGAPGATAGDDICVQ